MNQVWYVLGADLEGWPVLFATKMAAEMYARQVWPDADESVRYARIFYRSVWTEADMQEHASHVNQS
jgi:hypothetical protein